MEDLIPLLIFLFIGVNFAISVLQKAKAQSQRQKRLAGKTQKKPQVPETRTYQQTSQRVDRQRPRESQRTSWKEAPESKPSERKATPGDLIREWAKQLEDHLQPLFEPESQKKKEVEPKPPPRQTPPPTRVPEEAFPSPTYTKPAPVPKPRRAPVAQRRPPEPRETATYLGRLHPNPLINGIVLSEILGKPVAMRDKTPDLPG